MIETVTLNDFIDKFRAFNRYDNFGYEGLKALFEYLEEYEDSTGEQIELDVIALCCDYTFYESFEDFQKEYGDDYQSIEDLKNHTQVIMVDDESFIIQAF